VPSRPLAFIASSRQIIRNDAAINMAKKHHGAQAPLASIHVTTDFKLAV
jgi:hypothetical protein